MSTNTITLRSKSGAIVLVDEGESSKITSFFVDNDGVTLPGPSIQSLRLTLQVGESGPVINGRDDQDILGLDGGSVEPDGEFTLKLSELDNVILLADPGQNEIHLAIVKWTWTDPQGAPQIGFAKWQFTVVPKTTDPTPSNIKHGTVYIRDDFEVVRGDDYVGDDISWSDDGRWPDLDESSTAKVGFVGESTTIEYDAVITLGNTNVVSLPLTKEETAILRDWYAYDVQTTLSSGEVKTIVRGRVRASDTQTDIPLDSPLPAGSPA